MNIKTELLRADGYTDEEIQTVREHCDQAEATGNFSQVGALIHINGRVQLVCRTIAEILDTLRPGCWLDRYRMLKSDGFPLESNEEYAKGRIKLHYTFRPSRRGCPGGEYLWARQLSRNTAKIDSIPFGTGRLACGDVVRFNRDREITQLLEHVAKTRLLRYADLQQLTVEESADLYAQVEEKLRQHDIYTEAMHPGLCSISVPNDIEDDDLRSIAACVDATVITHDDEIQGN